jgi:hypothetical protein
MLNKLLERLNGHADDAASLEEALQQLDRDRAAARSALAELQVRRHQSLLDDASDKIVDEIERAIARTETRIEKFDLAEPGLRAQLNAGRAAADKSAGDETVTTYLGLSEDVARKVEGADAAAAVQRVFWNRHGAVLARLGVEPLGCALILGDGFGVAWAQRTRQVVAAVRAARERRDNPQLAPQSPARAQPQGARDDRPRLPHERGRTTSDAHNAVTAADGAPGLHSAAREGDDLAPLEPGQARVKVMRHGYSPSDDRPHCSYGQIARMPLGPAERAADRGAVLILEAYGDAEGARQASP